MKLKIWIIAFTLFIGFYVPDFNAQTSFTCTLANDSLTAPNIYEFDIYMLSNDTSTIELAGMNFGFLYNMLVQDTGTIKVSWVPNSSELTTRSQLPRNFKVTTGKKDSADVGLIILGPRMPPGYGDGSIISNKSLGTRIGRLRLTNSMNFTPARMNIEWNFLKTSGLYPTTITTYIEKLNTNVTSLGKYESKLVNPVLK
jgi:hypothetical protein